MASLPESPRKPSGKRRAEAPEHPNDPHGLLLCWCDACTDPLALARRAADHIDRDTCNTRAFDATHEMNNDTAVAAWLAFFCERSVTFRAACQRNRRYMPDTVVAVLDRTNDAPTTEGNGVDASPADVLCAKGGAA